MGDQKFRVGLNCQFIGKYTKASAVDPARNWVASQVSLDELIEHVREGYGFTAQFRDGYRKTANFICADVVAADFDGTMSLEEAQSSPFISQFAACLYTTPSHTAEKHRFRAVFLLEETITEPQDWADCLFGLAVRLGSDRSIKDAGRMFFGSLDCQVTRLDQRLPADEVQKLIALAHDERSRSSHPATSRAAITSTLKLGADQLVRLRNGNVAELRSLSPSTSVSCPYHANEHPSAFVVRSFRGGNGIHCMACNTTFWADADSPYDFSAFDRLIDERKTRDFTKRLTTEQDPNPFVAHFPPDPDVFVSQTKFLPKVSYRPGINVIKSPKGSGKTEALAPLIEQIRTGRFPREMAKQERPKSVLLIGHRQSLIKEAANRLGLDCYLDDERGATHRRKRFGYAICLDSLHKIASGSRNGSPPAQYDVVIIDESEQVISHLLSETLRGSIGMTEAFASLEFMIRRAKAVYALDADLGLITLHALKALRPGDWENALRIIQNKPLDVSDRREMLVYKSKKDIQEQMLDAVRSGRRCFIASNSKNTVEILEQMIRKEVGSEAKILAITSGNSRGELETQFVQNIQTEFLKVQALICSPSLGTGIDISFPDGRSEVQEVFGFFSPHVNKHTDIDQQLARVRNPGKVSVYFEAGSSNFETNLGVIRCQLALARYVPSALGALLDEDGNPTIDEDNTLLNIATHVMVAQRSSQNKIKSLFEELRRANGWDVVHVEKGSSSAGNGKWKDTQRDIEERRINGIVEARALTRMEFDELENRLRLGGSLSRQDKFALEKWQLERTYNRSVDRKMVELDKKGKLRGQIDQYRVVFERDWQRNLWVRAITEAVTLGTPIPKCPAWALVLAAIISAGLYADGEMLRDKPLRSSDLDGFKSMCSKNRVMIEDVMKSSMRADFMTNPVRQLNVFLAEIGLSIVKLKKQRFGDKTNISYTIDDDQLKLMGGFSANVSVERYI